MTDEILKPGERSRKPTFIMSIDTRMLYEHGEKMAVGEKVTDEKLNGIVARKGKNGAEPIGPPSQIYSAFRRLEREKSFVFGRIHKVGYVRLDDKEIVESGEALLKRAGRSARRGFHRMGRADYEKLTEGTKADHNAYASMFNALIVASRPATFKRVREQVAQSQQTLPLAATLKAFEK